MFLQKIQEELTRCLRPGEPLLVACSGGADSIALAHLIHALHKPLNVSFAVAHVDHGLRGEESRQDAQFVRDQAAKFGWNHYECVLDLNAQKKPRGIEALAREMRYQALEELARERGFSQIATAHHQEDQAETILLRLLQGAAPRHWTGMESARPIRNESPIRLLRPLLGISKREIRQWLGEHSLSSREDSSNRNPRFLRNRLRQFLNALEEPRKNELLHQVLEIGARARAARQLQERLEKQILKKTLRRWEDHCVLEVAALVHFPYWFAAPLVEGLLRDMGARAPRGTLQAVVGLGKRPPVSGKKVLDPGGIEILRTGNVLEFRRRRTARTWNFGNVSDRES